MGTKIEWTGESWNPVVGCTKVSEGCQNCYAERMAGRLANMHQEKYAAVVKHETRYEGIEEDPQFVFLPKWSGRIFCDESVLDKPLHWRKPRRIFVCSMGDLFHEKVPFEFIHRVFDIICKTPWHTYQIPTKRPKRLLEFTQTCAQHNGCGNSSSFDGARYHSMASWPHANVWLGVSVENQKEMWRAGILGRIPAAVRFISFEPLLGDITYYPIEMKQLSWVIIGAESGPKRRECKLEWVRDIVQQCKAADVPVFVKQLSINGKVEHNIEKFPEDLRLRQYPQG